MIDNNSSKPKALILEIEDDIRDYLEKILTLAGWEAFVMDESRDLSNILKKNISDPFALFIYHYDQSMGQDQYSLKIVRNISPITQRVILVTEVNSLDLSKLVNEIGIRACIKIPFTPKTFVRPLKACLAYFSKFSNRGRIQRIIAHQNRQLYGAAKKMKKREKALTTVLAEKVFQKETLKRVDELGTCSLKERIIYHDIPMTVDSISRERSGLENEIVRLFEQAARTMQLKMPQKKEINSLFQKSGEIEISEQAKTITQTLLGSMPDACLECLEEDTSDTVEEIFDDIDESSPLDPFFHVRISKDHIMGFIQKSDQITSMKEEISISELLEFLRTKRISYGIVSDKALESWLSTAEVNEPLQVAQGNPPFDGQNGKVTYHFENMTIQAGAINDDGSIDFKERSNIPYVSKGDLLATKSPAVQGSEGMSVNGYPIPVNDVLDPGFEVKSNAYFSDDGLSIFSSIDGQPHVNALGEISVNPEISIDGDVGYETGNIDFDGNVFVKGSIQEGFSVQCVNLTVEGIEGAEIFITGDLNVSAGITESNIRATGNIQAKFINRSFLSTFGNLTVQKEILDSQILLGGACNNAAGHIIASKVVARGGLEAGRIGTDSSVPCKIHIGGNELAKVRKDAIKKRIKKIHVQYQAVEKNIEELEVKDYELYPVIIKKTHSQESIAERIDSTKRNLARARESSDVQNISVLTQKLEKLENKISVVDKELDELFAFQEKCAKNIENLNISYEKLKVNEKACLFQLQEIEQFEKNNPVLAELAVNRQITRKTYVKGLGSSIVLDKEESACRIQEIRGNNQQELFYMIINEL